MFEIGSSLREARERRELELSQIERDTRIRTRYLQALEDERFDRLPAPGVRKGFPPDVRGLPRARCPALRRRVQQPLRSRRGAAGRGAGQDPPPRPSPAPAAGCRLRRRRRRLGRLGILARRGPPARGIQSAASTHAREHVDTFTGSTRGDPEAEQGADRTRSHPRSMLALGAPGLGEREAPVRGNGRAGADGRLLRASPLDPHGRTLEPGRDSER
jgi:Helix-turn-helix domain